ncbi:MAG: putative tRNA pseudouridine synthase B [Candidatus Woesearchaeota archaeon]|nr:putative tRNA pseudouridine synthase B [Candidatus Woesearchaeota archaeon]
MQILIRNESDTNPEYGCRPEDRTVKELINHGIVVIDKPAGPTSHQVSAFVKKILKIKKAGHSGTLDPNVTGVLPVTLGRATRVVQLLLESGKQYVGIMHLHKQVEESALQNTINKFKGEIDQLPPIKSSIKRRLRKRTIYDFEILEIDNKEVLFKVTCQAGTYIRKLVHDIGQELNVGAHMSQLRRTKVSHLDESLMVTLQDLRDAMHYYENGNDKFIRHCIKPYETALTIPKIWILDSAVESISQGASLKNPGISKLHDNIQEGDMVAVMTLKNELVCLGKAAGTSKQMLINKGLAVKSKKVFMKPGTYPAYQTKSNS